MKGFKIVVLIAMVLVSAGYCLAMDKFQKEKTVQEMFEEAFETPGDTAYVIIPEGIYNEYAAYRHTKPVVVVGDGEVIFDGSLEQMTIYVCKSVTIKNITFRNNLAGFRNAALNITKCRNVLIDSCRFISNKSIGLDVNGSEGVRVINCIFDRNGFNGSTVSKCTDFLMENCELSYNGWRTKVAWNSAAVKFYTCTDVIVRNTIAHHNAELARTIWFDGLCINGLVEGCTLIDNDGCGLFFEWSKGPLEIRNSVIMNNDYHGILIGGADYVTIKNCKIIDNQEYAIFVSTFDMEKEETVTETAHTTVIGNVIQGKPFGYWMTPEELEQFKHGVETDYSGFMKD